MKKGTTAVMLVVATTALVLTPLILVGIFLGYYVADVSGYSRSVLAIAFSTAGFIIGMALIFRVIRMVVDRTCRPTP